MEKGITSRRESGKYRRQLYGRGKVDLDCNSTSNTSTFPRFSDEEIGVELVGRALILADEPFDDRGRRVASCVGVRGGTRGSTHS